MASAPAPVLRVHTLGGEEALCLDAEALERQVETYGPSVLGLKRLLLRRLGRSIFRQQLTYQGRVLRNSDALADLAQPADRH